MPQCDEFSGPKVRSAASFHSNETWSKLGEELPHLRATQLAANQDAFFGIDAMNLKQVFRQIKADRGNLHVDVSSRLWPFSDDHHMVPACRGAGGVHPIKASLVTKIEQSRGKRKRFRKRINDILVGDRHKIVRGQAPVQCNIVDNETARLAALQRYNILDTKPEELFDRIARLAKMALQTPIVLVSHFGSNRQWFKSKQGLEATETVRSISFCPHAIEHLEHPLFCNNPLVLGAPHIRFYVGVPLRMHDGCKIGTLCAIDQQPRDMPVDQANAPCDLARIVVGEIELCQIATIDILTGALTRHRFDVEINREFSRSRQYRRDLSLIAVDVDHFRAVNDARGHPAGDQVLQSIIEQIKQELRPFDFICRVGGDEFVIALPETGSEHASQFAERVRRKIANTSVEARSKSIGVTISIPAMRGRRYSIEPTRRFMRRRTANVTGARAAQRSQCLERLHSFCAALTERLLSHA